MTLRVLIIGVMKKEQKTFSLEDLCTLVEMSKRKVRFYMQKGLVDRPEGVGKGAFYSHRHLQQLLTIRKWKTAGLSLERIQDLILDSEPSQEEAFPIPPPRRKRTGDVEVWSHLYIQDGIELHIEPQRSNLTPEQVRALCQEIVKQFEKIQSEEK